MGGVTQGAGEPAHAKDDVAPITNRALKEGGAIAFLRTLTDMVGPRVTGSENAEKAAALIRDTLKQAGFDNAHYEEYLFQPRWQRGTIDVHVAAPVSRTLITGSYGWVPGTNGRIEAPLADLGSPPGHDIAADTRLKGAAVLVDVHDIGAEPSEVMRAVVAQKLARAGAAVMLIPSDKPDRMVYTSGWGFYPHGPLPVLSIAREDTLFLRRLLRSGAVTLSLDVQNRFDDARATERNVVAEIPGRDPSQIVLVGAHFDSWDWASGADDNGSGVAAVLESARILKSLNLKPYATIRFVFFSGEEQANLGSRAYVARHAAELNRTRAFLMMDDGAQVPLGFKTNGRSELVQPLKTLLQPLASLHADGITDGADVESDNASFMAVGVPSLDLHVAEGDYDVRHHAIADTFDHVDPRHLAEDTAVMADAAYLIANDQSWQAARQSPGDVQQLFRKTGLLGAEETLFGPLPR
jgi:hypothetical protein